MNVKLLSLCFYPAAVSATAYTKSMSEKAPREGKAERASRWLRNFNLIGAVALGGAAVVLPPLSPILHPLAAIDVAQAGFFEVARRAAKRKKTQSLGAQ